VRRGVIRGTSMAIQSAKTQIQAVPYVDAALCQACRKCPARAVCKSKALIQLDPEEPPFVDASRCYGCDLCIQACPFGALRLHRD
jgi:Fe-S-cluster-containing hydrogenase component 2